MLNVQELPQPSASAQAISSQLIKHIRHAIASSDGHIGFDEYMRLALYEPGLGYYLAGAVKFGVDGDFVTAPEISPLFGHAIARQCAEVLEETGGDVFEIGAGTGCLASHALNELAKIGAPLRQYKILELSPMLREQQRQSIGQFAPTMLERVEWITTIPGAPIDGVILANEIVDALPVKLFKTVDGVVFERRVQFLEGRFTWIDIAADEPLSDVVFARLGSDIMESGRAYVSEINVGVEPWVADLSRVMGSAVALLIDYGFVRSDYYRRERESGTLMCHFRHRKHNDPFLYPGLQDITASTDFTAVAEAADSCELQVAGFTEQTNFLLGCGLLEEVERLSQTATAKELARFAYETKVLTLPSEMGTRFKVMALAKGYNFPLRGFHRRDDRHRL